MSFEISYDLIAPGDFAELVETVQSTFPDKEPMAVALGITPAEYRRYTELVCQKAVREGLTVVARMQDTHEIVGFCINEDFATAPVYSLEAIHPKMFPLLEILEDLDRAYLGIGPVPKQELFHLYMLGVRAPWERLGIGQELVQRSLHLARESGYRTALAEATGLGSQRLCGRLNFTPRHAIAYSQFQYQGRLVLREVKGPTHCVLFEISLV